MFKKSKRKIVIAIMSLLALVFITIICIIYITTCSALYSNNQNLLEDFTEKFIIEQRLKPPKDENKLVKSTVFYAVIFNNDNSVSNVINDVKPIMDDKALIDTTEDILKKGKSKGISKEFIYRVTKTDNFIYVTIMSNTIMTDSVTALIENTAIFGFLTLAVLFVFSFKLADKIVSPLEENHKRQKQFISDAGHELKTPIAIINANSEILEREIGENQWISNIKFESYRMQELIQQLLKLARMESISPMMERVNLSQIVLGGILPFESIAFENGYMIDNNIEDEVYVIGDKGQLGQLISTLTDNALSHAEGKGVISVTLKSEHNMAVFAISNPGKEIPIEDRENIFERFYKVDESRSLSGHYGLGLAIAKSIVNSHKGKIYVQCKDGIITFIVKIPQR